MTECPYCKITIDSDSIYCDQCGGKIYVCPSCNIFGKGEGKHCGLCGTKLVSAESLLSDSSKQPETDNNLLPPTYHKPESTGSVIDTISSTISSEPSPTVLKCAAENISLSLIDNAIIGRTTGNYVAQLGKLIYISGVHAQINKNGTAWSITDLESRNGTKVNGVKCSPTLSFKKGDTIKIANTYDFTVE